MSSHALAIRAHSGSVRKAMAAASRALSHAHRVKAKTETILSTAIHSTETMATAFGMGVWSGHKGSTPEVFGVPLDLGLGAALSLGGFLGLGGRNSDHLHGFANGFLAHFAVIEGMAVGQNWGKPKAATKGEGMSDAAIKRYAQGIG